MVSVKSTTKEGSFRTMDHSKRILVVEDEGLVALDLQDKLIRAGYDVPDVATSAEEALRGVAASMPDLVLMDVRLQGHRDGIQTAQEIRDQSQLPIIFVTANADPGTLQRARQSLPSGFFVKPIQFASLVSSIEMAIYKARMDQYALWRGNLQSSNDDIIFVTDSTGKIEFMNESAKRLMGSHELALVGQPVSSILLTSDGDALDFAKETLERASNLGSVPIPKGASLTVPGEIFKVPVEGNATIHDFGTQPSEFVFTLRDASGRDWNDQQLRAEQRAIAQGYFASGVNDTVYGLFHLIAGRHAQNTSESERQLACDAGMGISQQLASVAKNQTPSSAPINVNEFIEKNMSIFQKTLGEKVNFSASLCIEPTTVRMPVHSLGTVLMNILLSAKRKLAGTGVIHLSTKVISGLRDNVRLEFRLERAGPAAWTPFGFPFEAEAFDVDISVANAIVTAVEGRLQYDQRWANSAQIEVLLPRSQTVGADTHSIASLQTLVLLIGTGRETTRAMETQLKTNGCRVIRSASAAEALIVAQFHEGRIDAVVADVDTISPRCRDRVQRAFLDHNPDTKFVWGMFDWESLDFSRALS